MKDKELYKKLDELILTGNAGSVKTLANKLDCKPRTVRHMLEVLKLEHNCPATFNPVSKSYYYERPGRFIQGFHDCKADVILKEIDVLRQLIQVEPRN